MRMRITGNVWRDGRVLAVGAEVELPEVECERLAVLGVADPVSVHAPEHASATLLGLYAEGKKQEPVTAEPERPKKRRRK